MDDVQQDSTSNTRIAICIREYPLDWENRTCSVVFVRMRTNGVEGVIDGRWLYPSILKSKLLFTNPRRIKCYCSTLLSGVDDIQILFSVAYLRYLHWMCLFEALADQHAPMWHAWLPQSEKKRIHSVHGRWSFLSSKIFTLRAMFCCSYLCGMSPLVAPLCALLEWHTFALSQY